MVDETFCCISLGLHCFPRLYVNSDIFVCVGVLRRSNSISVI